MMDRMSFLRDLVVGHGNCRQTSNLNIMIVIIKVALIQITGIPSNMVLKSWKLYLSMYVNEV